MATEPIISVSGLRGIVGESLTPAVALRYANAFAAGLPAGPLVLTRDGRATGRLLADVVRGALCAAGRDVIDANVAATPTTGVLVRQYRAAGGIQISASHNPPEYNGLKLFGGDGRVISAEAGEQVLVRYRDQEPAWVRHESVGYVRPCEDSTVEHLSLILANVDLEAVRRRHFNVLLDSNHGAGGMLGRQLLQELGCDAILVGAEPDGQFAHPPEPTADNLSSVCQLVRESEVDAGFCQDPDADRLALIDEQGRYVGEEYTLAVCVNHILSKQQGPIVTNCSTSRMSEDLAAKYGVPFFRSLVGEANVADKMIAEQAIFGGEGNGGPIDPRVGYVRDSFVGLAMVLNAMAVQDVALSQLVNDLPRYAIHKAKVQLNDRDLDDALDGLEKHFPTAAPDRLDGLRLDWPNKWLLVRPSNTEPILRIIAEAESAKEAEHICTAAANCIADGQSSDAAN